MKENAEYVTFCPQSRKLYVSIFTSHVKKIRPLFINLLEKLSCDQIEKIFLSL